MTKTRIEWCDEVWNPTTGCSKVSEGCRNCYAERAAKRFWGDRAFTDVQCHEDRLDQPLHWRKPRRVFVDSMSDLFHEDVPDKFILDVWRIMAGADKHTFMVLTKRPDRMKRLLSRCKNWEGWMTLDGKPPKSYGIEDGIIAGIKYDWPPKNVFVGVSVENQKAADERVPVLLETPAAVRFVSCEPLLGEVDLFRAVGLPNGIAPGFSWKRGSGLDWVICGGESGPDARPMHPDWARSLRDQCGAAGVPYFFKQWGEFYPNPTPIVVGVDYGSKNICVKLDGKIGDQLDYAAGQAVIMDRVGKKAAGRLLDGRKWNEVPGENNIYSNAV